MWVFHALFLLRLANDITSKRHSRPFHILLHNLNAKESWLGAVVNSPILCQELTDGNNLKPLSCYEPLRSWDALFHYHPSCVAISPGRFCDLVCTFVWFFIVCFWAHHELATALKAELLSDISYDCLLFTQNVHTIERYCGPCELFFCIHVTKDSLQKDNDIDWRFARVIRKEGFNPLSVPSERLRCFSKAPSASIACRFGANQDR